MVTYAVSDVLNLVELKKRILTKLHNTIEEFSSQRSEKAVVNTLQKNHKLPVKFDENWRLIPRVKDEPPILLRKVNTKCLT